MARKNTVEEALNEMQDEIKASLDLTEEEPARKLARRRTEDEMRHALRLILSGEVRPRDDESVQVLEDAINEIFALRQMNMDLMQTLATAYQQGLASIRKLTDR